jgi:capsular polysaccharide biosynthesis protein
MRKPYRWVTLVLTIILGIVGGLALVAILDIIDELKRRKKVVQ